MTKAVTKAATEAEARTKLEMRLASALAHVDALIQQVRDQAQQSYIYDRDAVAERLELLQGIRNALEPRQA